VLLGKAWPREQVKLARARYEGRDVTVAEIAKAFGVGRGTIYRALQHRGMVMEADHAPKLRPALSGLTKIVSTRSSESAH